jgi:hypothetical protein
MASLSTVVVIVKKGQGYSPPWFDIMIPSTPASAASTASWLKSRQNTREIA